MAELPHAILGTKNIPAAMQHHVGAHLDLLRELANYGSNLIFRAIASSPRQLQDVIVCGGLLRQFVSMLDATEVLLRTSCVHAAHLPARAAFEASLYIEWMLVSDLEKKATYYYVATMRRERLWAKRMIRGTSERDGFDEAMGEIGEEVHRMRPELSAEGVLHLDEVNKILARPQFSEVDTAFDAYRKTKRHDPDWYKPLGVKSIRELAHLVHRLPEYDMMYASGSEAVHGSSYKDHIRFAEKGVQLKSIRQIEGANTVLNFACSCAIVAYQRVLTFYRPAELPSFWKQYVEEWRERYVSIPDIQIADGPVAPHA